MKNIYGILIFIVVGVIFTACGGSGASNDANKSVDGVYVEDDNNDTKEPVVDNKAPIITGVTANQAVDDNKILRPFIDIAIDDEEGDNISVVITVDDKAKGILSATTISSNTIDNIEASLRAITFTPTSNRVAVGATETTTITITVDDGTKSTTNSTVIVSTSVNDAPTDITLSNNRVNQSAGVGATVGIFSTTDVDIDETFAYTLIEDANSSSFTIDGSTLKTEDTDILSAGVYSININTNDGNSNLSKAFTITLIDDKNDTEEPVVDNNETKDENKAPIITGVTANQAVDDNVILRPFSEITIDDEEGDNISVVITVDDKAKGILSATTIPSNTIDNIEASLRAITFTPTSNRVAVGATETTTLTLIVNDGVKSIIVSTVIVAISVNDAPTDIQLSNNRVNQSAGVSATIGTLSTIDMDINETFAYTLIEDINSSSFIIDGSTLKTEDTEILSAGVYSIKVNTSDGDSNFSKDFNITVIDDNTLEKIAIDIECTTPATVDDYIELLKGDTIVKSEDNTTVSIYHDENDNKRVCLEFGEAYIERES